MAVEVRKVVRQQGAYQWIEITVETVRGWIQGRNGLFDLKAVTLSSYTHDPEAAAWVNGIGKRGKEINGGLSMSVDELDALCQGWLEARGKKVLSAPEKTDEAALSIVSGEVSGNPLCPICGSWLDIVGAQWLGKSDDGWQSPGSLEKMLRYRCRRGHDVFVKLDEKEVGA